ncbi:hypothetical protein DPMN_112774 [Dreissena polymorpha]|uniref:Uncharacterized protein n=1 Tax=Dreissena polymorpha TaxID=45954 RepID=A0A9D4KG97_DREPO|nr:hypothetical protein DPMN_112774 [Dreissena polymorpha]
MNVINDDVQYITHSILDLRHLKGFAGWNEWGDHIHVSAFRKQGPSGRETPAFQHYMIPVPKQILHQFNEKNSQLRIKRVFHKFLKNKQC